MGVLHDLKSDRAHEKTLQAGFSRTGKHNQGIIRTGLDNFIYRNADGEYGPFLSNYFFYQ